MKIIRFLLKFSPASFLLAIGAGLVSGLMSSLVLAFINGLLNDEITWPRGTVVWSFVTLCLVVPVSQITSMFLLARLGQSSVEKLRLKVSRQVIQGPLDQLEKIGSSRLLASLTNDIDTVSGALVIIPGIATSLAIVMGCLAFLVWLSPGMFLWLLLFLVIGLVTYQIPQLIAVKRFRLAFKERDRLYEHFRGLVEGAKELKLGRSRRKDFFSTLAKTARSIRTLNLSAVTTYSAAASWGETLGFIVIGGFLLGFAGFQEVARDVLTGYTLVVLYLMTPLQQLMNSAPQFARASVAVSSIESLGLSLLNEAAQDEPEPGQPADADPKRLELSGVKYSYQGTNGGEVFSLGPIDLDMAPGETVFIIGGNGSGKTTLAKVLAGLYVPIEGSIRLGGETVEDGNRDRYREQFAVVFYDFYLFDRLLGLSKLDLDRRAGEYLEKLGIAGKVDVENGMFSTTALSQGQRRRLAMLGAYLEDRPIYIFDEWAADQDPKFKDVFYYEILKDLKNRGKTVIVISHDDRYYQEADRLVKLDYGRLVAPEIAGVSVIDGPRESNVLAWG